MARKKKGRSRHGSGTIVDWVRNGKKVGRKGYVELERGPNGKRNRKIFYGKTDTEIQAKMDEFRGQLKMGVEVVTSSRHTLQQYLDWWLKDVAVLTIKPVTLDSYERKLRVHVYPKLGKVMLTDLKPTHLTSLYAGIIRSGLSKRTGQYVHAVIHKALQDAVSHRLVPYNVAANVKAPKPDKKEAAFIPPEKIAALCDAITGDWLAPSSTSRWRPDCAEANSVLSSGRTSTGPARPSGSMRPHRNCPKQRAGCAMTPRNRRRAVAVSFCSQTLSRRCRPIARPRLRYECSSGPHGWVGRSCSLPRREPHCGPPRSRTTGGSSGSGPASPKLRM